MRSRENTVQKYAIIKRRNRTEVLFKIFEENVAEQNFNLLRLLYRIMTENSCHHRCIIVTVSNASIKSSRKFSIFIAIMYVLSTHSIYTAAVDSSAVC